MKLGARFGVQPQDSLGRAASLAGDLAFEDVAAWHVQLEFCVEGALSRETRGLRCDRAGSGRGRALRRGGFQGARAGRADEGSRRRRDHRAASALGFAAGRCVKRSDAGARGGCAVIAAGSARGRRRRAGACHQGWERSVTRSSRRRGDFLRGGGWKGHVFSVLGIALCLLRV